MAATMALLLLLLTGVAAAADPTTMTLRVVPDSIASPLGARCLDGAIATTQRGAAGGGGCCAAADAAD